ncbi:MAG TPA: hypothetical protein VMW35_20275 [Myxococcota bacterium]|nr:hypothetical protein [Myxococcota bacterium]
MPIDYRIDKQRGVVWSRATGVVTDADLLQHQERLRRDPDFQPHFRQLFDFTSGTVNAVTGRAIRQLAAAPAFGKGSKRALLVHADSAFGLARMFQTLRDEQEDEVAVFRDEAAARAWLGVE